MKWLALAVDGLIVLAFLPVGLVMAAGLWLEGAWGRLDGFLSEWWHEGVRR